MKGDIAMKKLDLISDEYIREAEIPEDLEVIVTEKHSFWQKLSHFMNSPVGVAMLCAVVSLSVLAIIVMAGTGRWSGWQPPAGTHVENESPSTQVVTLSPVETLDAKSFVPEFYQALKDKDMIGKIPDPTVNGGLISSSDPIYIVEEADIHNTTPPDVYEKTGAMIFNAGVMVYLWMDSEIYILNKSVVFGSGFTGAVLCDYDQNGIEDIFCGYITSLSGVWYTDFVVFDVADKALRHSLQRPPSANSSSAIGGCRIFCDLGVIQKRITDGKDYYDIVKLTGELVATYIPTPGGLFYYEQNTPSCETTPIEIDPLSPAMEKEIKEAFLSTQVSEDIQSSYTIDDLSLRYYGCYSGGHVMFVDGIFEFTQVPTADFVHGYTFSYGSSQHLWYYKDGQFYSLFEANLANLLSAGDAKILHDVYYRS